MLKDCLPVACDGKRALYWAALFFVFALCLCARPALAGEKTGGGYVIANDELSIAGDAVLTGGTYTVISSVGRETGYADLFQALGNFLTGYMLEGGYVSGIEAVFDVYAESSVVTAPVGGGYLGGAADVVPGARIAYTVNYSNKGEAAINHVTGAAVGYSKVQLQTLVPAEVVYEPGTITLNAAAQTDVDDFPADACYYNAGTTQVICIVPLTAGASGSFSFSGIVK